MASRRVTYLQTGGSLSYGHRCSLPWNVCLVLETHVPHTFGWASFLGLRTVPTHYVELVARGSVLVEYLVHERVGSDVS